MPKRRNAFIVTTLLLGLLTACRPQPQQDLFVEAETMVLDGRFDEAIPVWKEHLLSHPEDAGAHYYLARCYLFGTKAWYALVQGELETALYYFEKNGRTLPIPRFNEPSYFEMMCYVDMAKMRMKQIVFLVDHGASATDIREFVRHLRTALSNAQAILPDAPEVQELQQHVAGFEALIDTLPPAIAPPAQRPPEPPPSDSEAPPAVYVT